MCLLDSLALIFPGTVAFTNARKTPPMPLYGSEDTVHAEQSCSAGPFTTKEPFVLTGSGLRFPGRFSVFKAHHPVLCDHVFI